MARTVVALYEDFASANAAVRELVDNGFSREDISIMAGDVQGEYSRQLSNPTPAENTTSCAGVGAGVGAVVGGLGGLLIGLGALVIPGIGPVIAAGPLAAALAGLAGAGAGAVAGGVAGGLIGALVDMGIPNQTAQYYAEGIRRGGTLVTVRTSDDMAERARAILNHHSPVNINDRVGQWRETGWTGSESQMAPSSSTSSSRTMAGEPQNQPIDNDRPAMQVGTEPSTNHPPSDMDMDIDQGSNITQTASTPPDYADFSTYDAGFRSHFATTMPDSGYTYEQYQPAYRYGYDLATNPRFQERDWNDVEPEAQRFWDERNPGTWDRVKGVVRYAYEEIRDSTS